MSQRVFFVSLGCPKNRVDTEVMLGDVLADGHELVTAPEDADVIVVNTCGFIGEAKEESVDTILEMARYKTEGKASRLVVTGCLTQRYPKEVADDMPEVDMILGSGDVGRVAAAIRGEGPRVQVTATPAYLYDAATRRELAGPSYSAYVKIAEGCDRPCAFCIIPDLRGPQRSRGIDDVVREVEGLVARGTREVNLVAQDLTKYGDDLSGGLRPLVGQSPTSLPTDAPTLAMLLRKVARVPGLTWVRLHYAYPTAVTDELIDVIATEPAVAKYLDVPFQHADDRVLKLMRRGHGRKQLESLVTRLRDAIPEITLRTTFLVGHPGETEASFGVLNDFVKGAGLDRVGVFAFSSEEGTASHELGEVVPARTAKARKTALLRTQRSVSRKRLKAMVGRELEVLVEGPSKESEYLLEGRWEGQAPEVDGVVYLADGTARAGDFVRARVTGFADHDLAASILRVSSPRPRPAPSSLKLPVVA